MAPYFEDELLKNTSFKQVTETLKTWPTDFKVQVNPREVNLFYLTDAYRKRIIPVENGFAIDDTDIVFTTASLLEELEVHPERFSPNVIMRPLYQEVILPNLCYIGGGGELAYWLELKAYFEEVDVVFPMLLLRNSALLVTHKQDEKLANMECAIQDLFLQEHELASVVTTAISAIDIDFTNLQKQLKQQFESLYDIAAKTDKSFVGAVAAQEKKQLNGLENLEKRLLKAQKHKHSDHVERAVQLQLELFPGGTLQERKENFASFYLDHGQELLQILKDQLDPLDPSFTVITLPVL
jgi:bacillithiol biosynthesis cysteine-adding enzyme BshC